MIKATITSGQKPQAMRSPAATPALANSSPDLCFNWLRERPLYATFSFMNLAAMVGNPPS